jgi:hypothetical protein
MAIIATIAIQVAERRLRKRSIKHGGEWKHGRAVEKVAQMVDLSREWEAVVEERVGVMMLIVAAWLLLQASQRVGPPVDHIVRRAWFVVWGSRLHVHVWLGCARQDVVRFVGLVTVLGRRAFVVII